MSATERRNLR